MIAALCAAVVAAAAAVNAAASSGADVHLPKYHYMPQPLNWMNGEVVAVLLAMVSIRGRSSLCSGFGVPIRHHCNRNVAMSCASWLLL
jgi:hypothetical protein